jgi:prepilin-type N-terminal cleavage/methylation domain-containing protein
MKHKTKFALQGGFSLVELLTVITVIGVIAGMAIPNLGSLNSSANETKNLRNAQSIVSTFMAASSAGVTFTSNTRNGIVGEIITGVTPADGIFVGRKFSVPNMAASELTNAAYKYIKMEADGSLTFVKAGGQPGT